eukprot:TRINITY_DN1257_c0_g2_i21.p1 TRINITY_DN1257_c0_g2~~TRINITY_DN1257_c0_g2_i21.p1  ORF type:complete len:348 (+),score=50.10 TRINITY_DN1257_c0_g2_i21:208-1251(+)
MRKNQTILIKDKFGGSSTDVLEEEFKNNTVGLVTNEEFKKKREKIESFLLKKKLDEIDGDKPKPKEEKKKVRRTVSSQLSFLDGEEEEAEEEAEESLRKEKEEKEREDTEEFGDKIVKKRAFGKNPTVDTSFLPDKDREERERELRKQLAEEYVQQQEIIKNQILELKCTYWDGSNSVKAIRIKKDTKIGNLLEMCRKELARDFPELRSTTGDGMLLVINDAIVPHNVSFYELLRENISTKHGPLITLTKCREPQTGEDYEIDEGKPYKIVEKKWYDRNKHIYPCTIWETIDVSRITGQQSDLRAQIWLDLILVYEQTLRQDILSVKLDHGPTRWNGYIFLLKMLLS